MNDPCGNFGGNDEMKDMEADTGDSSKDEGERKEKAKDKKQKKTTKKEQTEDKEEDAKEMDWVKELEAARYEASIRLLVQKPVVSRAVDYALQQLANPDVQTCL